jgi:hypothetical protein
MTGNLEIGTAGNLTFEGATADGFDTTLAVVDPTADRTITLPNVTGTVVTTGDTGTITSTMIANSTITDDDISGGASIADTKLATITAAGKVSNSATTATHVNTGSTIVARDVSGNFSAGSITASLNGIAAFVSTNANLTGDVTSVGNATAIAAGVIVDADVNASAAIVDTKLATISTALKVSNSATTAASANTASAIVARDASGNFTAGTITAALTGAASSNVLKAGDTMTGALAVTAGTAALPGIAVSGDTNTGLFSPGADQLAISTGGTERARIDSSGRLLVGTSTSANNTRLQQKLAIVHAENGSYTGAQFTGYSGTTVLAAPLLELCRSRGTSDGTMTKVESGDRIGLIQFRGSDGSAFQDMALIDCYADGATGAGDTPGRLVFSTTADGAASPTERMRITNAGRVELGDAIGSNTTFFYVKSSLAANPIGAFYASSASYTGSLLGLSADRNTTNGTYNFLACTREGSAFALFIRDSGNVVNANNSYGAISDAKLKENIFDANSQWDDLKALQVRNYNFKEGQTHTQIGLVAQEAELVSPGLVSESPDRDEEGNDLGTVTKSVNYSVLYMKAVKALQEAMERIEALEASNADMLARVTALEGA